MSPFWRVNSAPPARALVLCGALAATAAVTGSLACDWKPATSLVKVSSIEPSSGPAGVVTNFRIIGDGFQSGATVLMGGHNAAVVVVNETTIVGTTPAIGEGVVDVIVRNADGGRGTLFNGFTFVR
jgi:hypothetical protein